MLDAIVVNAYVSPYALNFETEADPVNLKIRIDPSKIVSAYKTQEPSRFNVEYKYDQDYRSYTSFVNASARQNQLSYDFIVRFKGIDGFISDFEQMYFNDKHFEAYVYGKPQSLFEARLNSKLITLIRRCKAGLPFYVGVYYIYHNQELDANGAFTRRSNLVKTFTVDKTFGEGVCVINSRVDGGATSKLVTVQQKNVI